MSKIKTSGVDSVRAHWIQQRKGEDAVAQQPKNARGSHFASPSPAASEALGEQEESRQSRADSRSHFKITGVSGEIPKVPIKVREAQIDSYSRYNERYTTNNPRATLTSKPSGASLGGFATQAVPGQPAYSWKPFVLYGGCAAIASLLWVVFAKLTGSGAPVMGSLEMNIAMVLLCLVVIAGAAVIASTTMITKRSDDQLPTADIVASALGKGSVMTLVGVAVWIVSVVLATLVVA